MAAGINRKVFSLMREILVGGLAGRRKDPTYRLLAPHEGFLLEVIAAREPISMKELSLAVGALPNTMTGVVDRLVRRGILTRDSSPDDRRIVLVRLTALGSELQKKAQKFFLDYTTGLLACLSGEEKRAMVALLERITRSLPS